MRKPGSDPTLEAERKADGRNVAPDLGALLGEGALQRVRDPELPAAREYRLRSAAALPEVAEEGRSYYGLPLLQEPVWKWYIPAYFFTGGLAGACGVLGAAAQLAGADGADPLVRRCRAVAAGGAIASAGLLIADLGRPERFLHMLRVFRPTSPMNMGSWLLTAFGAAAVAAALPSFVRAPRALARLSDVAGLQAGLLGLPLVGYTGVLISNTAVPVWQGTRNTLPILFAFSGAVSAGGLLQAWPTRAGAHIATRFGRIAKAAELASAFALDREAAAHAPLAAAHAPRVARPLQRGASGAMLRAARALVAASLAVDVWSLLAGGGRSRWRRAGGDWRGRLSGALALAGTALLRFGIAQAGRTSARDPHASFELQRRGRGGAEEARKSGVARAASVPGVGARKEPPDARPGL
jgi:formate-dependent nitrite reductase membrane component NrfD